MKQPSHATSTSSKSIVLVGSTSSYFGGTGVTAYVASKHGVLGLLRASQSTARGLGVRVNGIAPFLTPTHITAGFAQRWRDQGLEENTPERVAEAIALIALDETRQGDCVLVSNENPSSLGRWQVPAGTRVVQDEVASYLDRGRSCRVHGAHYAVLCYYRRICTAKEVLKFQACANGRDSKWKNKLFTCRCL
jgi:NAD(P)-dependent dehydrogenase (short-subunit alcohol dehydrogenase family)